MKIILIPDHPTFGYNPMLILQGYYVGELTSEKRNFLKNRGRLALEIVNVLEENVSEREKTEMLAEGIIKRV